MDLFRTVALGVFLVGFVTFSQRVEAFPEHPPNEKVHEQLISAQIAEFLGSADNAVLQQEVTQFQVARVSKRDSEQRSEVILGNKAFRGVKLRLEPAESVLAGKSTPVHLAKVDHTHGTRVFYERVTNAWENVGTLLEDPIQRASLMQRTNSKGQLTYDGFIEAQDLVVRSLPESISDKLQKQNSSRDSDASQDSKTAYHIVYKKQHNNSIANDEGKAITESHISLNATMYGIPNVVYPEILVFVDHTVFGLHKNNITNTLMYILAFWNGVDLIYRRFEEPRFRFNIARVIIGVEGRSTPWIADSMYNSMLINMDKAEMNLKRFFSKSLPYSSINKYDVAVGMTGMKITQFNGQEDVRGFAMDSGMCKVHGREYAFNGILLLVDDGTFYSVRTAAHEFAHLLGVDHDWNTSCARNLGYLMGMLNNITESFYDFTTCTIEKISYFLRRGHGLCMYNKPNVKDPLPRVLPASLSDRDHQCKMLGKGPSCYTGEPWQHPCLGVYCNDTATTPSECQTIKYYTPADGVDCGDGKKCFHGKCLSF